MKNNPNYVCLYVPRESVQRYINVLKVAAQRIEPTDLAMCKILRADADELERQLFAFS